MINKERRIELKRGKQKNLILNAINTFGSLKNLAIKLRVPYPTFKNYFQESRLLPEKLFDKILKLSSIEKNDLNLSYLPYNWGQSKGGKKGMKTLEKKYPHHILQWRRKGLKNSNRCKTKEINYPKLNEKLAEFIGVYLGDGTLTKYFIRISGDSRYDGPYFNYLNKLIDNLFGIIGSITKDKKHNTMYLTIFSKKLCSFLKKEYKLNYGHKIINKTSIPKQILNNRKLLFVCIRGLVDTDGSVSRRGIRGSQFCIQFTSHNKNLLKQVEKFMRKEKFFTFSDKTGTGTNSKEKIFKYFKEIGSANLRHIIRFYERFYSNKNIYRKDVIDYYQKDFYKNLNFPFKLVL